MHPASIFHRGAAGNITFRLNAVARLKHWQPICCLLFFVICNNLSSYASKFIFDRPPTACVKMWKNNRVTFICANS